MRIAHTLGIDDRHFYDSIHHVDGGKGWRVKSWSIRNTLGGTSGKVTSRASGPEKIDQSCEGRLRSEATKVVAASGVVTVHVSGRGLPRRSSRLEHNLGYGFSVDGGKGWQQSCSQSEVRWVVRLVRWRARRPNPKKPTGLRRICRGSEVRKYWLHQGLRRYMSPRCWLSRRSWWLEHNQCRSPFNFCPQPAARSPQPAARSPQPAARSPQPAALSLQLSAFSSPALRC